MIDSYDPAAAIVAAIDAGREAVHPPAPAADDTISSYGLRVLAYLLAEGEVFGLLSDDDLEAAHYATRYAVTAPEILPLAVEKITVVQARITTLLARRAAELAQSAAAPSPERAHHTPPTQPETRPPGGSRVPTHPRPPAPPSADALRPVYDFQF